MDADRNEGNYSRASTAFIRGCVADNPERVAAGAHSKSLLEFYDEDVDRAFGFDHFEAKNLEWSKTQ